MYLRALSAAGASPDTPLFSLRQPAQHQHQHGGTSPLHPRQPSPYSEHWSSLIGIVTAIVGNVLISFALNMQRYAHIRLDREFQQKRSASSSSLAKLPAADRDDDGEGTGEAAPLLGSSASRGSPGPDKQQSYLTSPYWWAGIVLMTVGEAGNFLAYGFAPASIVSPLGVVALISNCIIAPFMLKERFRWRDAAGVVVAVGGAVTVVLSASSNNPKLGPEEIWGLIRRWEFETYLGVTVGVIVVLMWASNRYGEKNILIDLGLVGLFGGYTALSTKGVASLLSYTLWRAITFPVFYLLLAILIGTAVMQIKYINRALQRFSATQVIPVQFVMFTLSVILGSAILYRDFERTSGDHAGKFVGGCAMTFTGVWLITSGRPSREDEDEDEEEVQGDVTEDQYQDTTPSDDVSRRSSTIRAVSPTRPETPIIKLTPDPTSLSSLIENPWSVDLTSSKPSIARHTSVPVLPSEAAPAQTPQHHPSSPPRTPPRQPSDPNMAPLTPQTSTPGLRRLRTAERRVGPLLASPLSTSLTAVVQDLKRGRARSRDPNERRGSALGIVSSTSTSDADGAWQASYSGEGGLGAPFEPLGRRRTQGDSNDAAAGAAGSVSRPAGRGRSLSGTLGGLLRGLRGSASREDMGGRENV